MEQFTPYTNKDIRGSNFTQRNMQYHKENMDNYEGYVNREVEISNAFTGYQRTDNYVNVNERQDYSQENTNEFVRRGFNQYNTHRQQNVNQFNVFQNNPNQFSNYIQQNYSDAQPHQISNYSQQNAYYTRKFMQESRNTNEVEDNPDDAFINELIAKINKRPASNKISKQKTDNLKNVSTIKSQLKRCFEIFDKLESVRNELHEKIEMISSEDWNLKTSEINSLSRELTNLIKIDDVQRLKKTIEKRARKRALQCERMNLEKKEVLEENSRRHEEIDRWLENKRDEVERVKAEENMKKDADCVLAEVTKKKSDGKKQMNLIEALIKLRAVREKAAVNRGEKLCPEDSNAFEKTCEKLNAMWGKSMGVYAKEEQGLRIMLEEGDEKERKCRKQSGREGIVVKKWESVIFGDDTKSDGALYWGLTQAERDFETFVAIRKSWDTFLCDNQDANGTAIPIGWVLPNNNPNEAWKQFLKP